MTTTTNIKTVTASIFFSEEGITAIVKVRIENDNCTAVLWARAEGTDLEFVTPAFVNENCRQAVGLSTEIEEVIEEMEDLLF